MRSGQPLFILNHYRTNSNMDFMRLMLVLACMAPLFILMAIRGIAIVPWEFYCPIFLALAAVPNFYLIMRMWAAVKANDRKLISISRYTDNREHLITYIFALLLPLFQTSVSTLSDLYAGLCALIFVVYIFGHMELYYMNLFFSLAGYRVFTIHSSGGFSADHVLITKKKSLNNVGNLTPIRVTDFLLFDK